jgi:DNA-binding PadR family transcriptional regulator
MLEFIILGTLYTDSLTGYDIRKCIEGSIGMFYRASYGSIYPLLGRLLDKGYVICSNEVEGKREKKMYTITECGRKNFIKWLEEDDHDVNSMESFMAKVFYYDKLPFDIASNKISMYEKKLLDYYQHLLSKKESFDVMENKKEFYFKLSTLYFGICKLQSIITWCETVKNGNDLDTLVQQIGREL